MTLCLNQFSTILSTITLIINTQRITKIVMLQLKRGIGTITTGTKYKCLSALLADLQRKSLRLKDLIKMITIWKISDLQLNYYTDDSGDYEHEYSVMEELNVRFVATKNEKEIQNLYEYCAEPDIHLTKICSINEYQLKEFKKLINTI